MREREGERGERGERNVSKCFKCLFFDFAGECEDEVKTTSNCTVYVRIRFSN